LRAVTALELIGERQIIIDCDVLQADGGTRTASITGGFVALYQCVSFMTATQLISRHAIKVLIHNRQTSTPITENLKQLAANNSIPVVGISETVQPATSSFQDWQTSQLNALQAALGRQ